jgi:WD40 repeat protein
MADAFKQVKDVGRKEIVFRLARVPGGDTVFFGGSDFKVSRIDLAAAKPEPVELGAHTSYVSGLVLAGSVPVSGGYDGRLIWWDADKKAPIRTVEAHAKWVRNLAVSADGKLLASVSDDMTAKLWDAATGKLVRELKGHAEKTPHHYPSMLYAVAFAPDGQHVATGDKTGKVIVWETATGKQAAAVECPVMYTWDPTARRHSIGGLRSLAFSADGTLLAAGGMGKVGNIDHLEGKARVEVFDWRAGKRTHEFPGDKFNGLVERLAFGPDGKTLAAVGGAHDGFYMTFDLKAGKPDRQEKVPTHVHDLALSDGRDKAFVACHGRLAVYALTA